MIEPIMFFGIGFLAAALIGLVIVPLVHTRAIRLTVRRLEAGTVEPLFQGVDLRLERDNLDLL